MREDSGRRKGPRGEVTIFISMVMMCVFSLFCVLLESARTMGARWYLQTAASSALDSVFSQYHRQLWDSYRLLFAEYDETEELEADFSRFLEPYLENSGWYPMTLQAASVEEWLTATDDQGTYLEQEILDYMKYGVWDLDFGTGTVEELRDQAREAEAVKTVAGSYREQAKKALKLERSLEAISESQDRRLAKKQEGMSRLRSYDGSGFRRIGKELIRELERMPGLVAEYRRQADRLAGELRQSRELYEGERTSCSEEVNGKLDSEIRSFEEYVDEDGQRRREIEALEGQSYEQAALVREVMDESEEVERIIEEWEEDEDDEDSEGPDLAALWGPVIRHFDRFSVRPLSFSHGVKDKEKEGWLKQVEELYRSGLLTLVVPEGMEISRGLLDSPELPSQSEIMMPEARTISLPDHLLVNEYCGRFFRCLRTGQEGEISQQIGVEGEGGLSYEMEYLIGGQEMDEANLTSAVHRLLAIREGLNMIHILSDGQKRADARNLAMMITGVAGLSPLVLLTTFFVMSVWALGESLMDVRGLLAGKKVVLFKAAGDWTLEIGQLLAMGKEGEIGTGGGERGLTYLSWLKLLLFMDEIVQQEYRMMDMIQMNICRKQASFRMRRGVYQVKLLGELIGKHVFFSLGFVENSTGSREHTYPMKVAVERIY